MTHTDKLLWISRELLLTSGCVRKTSMNHLLIKGEIVLIADEKHLLFFLSNSFMLAFNLARIIDLF